MTEQTTERKMFEGNWKCSKCGASITKLPFEPNPEREGELLCKECHSAGRGDRNRREKKMYEGRWTCSGCGGAITSLPFEPRDESNLKCRDCFRKG